MEGGEKMFLKSDNNNDFITRSCCSPTCQCGTCGGVSTAESKGRSGATSSGGTVVSAQSPTSA